MAYSMVINGSGFADHEVLLDSESDTNVVRPELLHNIRGGYKDRVCGLGGPPVDLPLRGDLEGFFECASGNNLRASVLCLADVAELYPVEYIQSRGFVVHMPGRDLEFVQRGKMHVADMSDWLVDQWTMVNTSAENEKYYTKKEVARARKAQELVANAGFLSEKEAVDLVQDGNITGVPVTAKDVRRAFDIYGKPIEFVRGRMTKKKHSREEIDEAIRQPGRREHCDLYSDVMYVRRKGVLVSMAAPIGLVMVNAVEGQHAPELGGALLAQVKML